METLKALTKAPEHQNAKNELESSNEDCKNEKQKNMVQEHKTTPKCNEPNINNSNSQNDMQTVHEAQNGAEKKHEGSGLHSKMSVNVQEEEEPGPTDTACTKDILFPGGETQTVIILQEQNGTFQSVNEGLEKLKSHIKRTQYHCKNSLFKDIATIRSDLENISDFCRQHIFALNKLLSEPVHGNTFNREGPDLLENLLQTSNKVGELYHLCWEVFGEISADVKSEQDEKTRGSNENMSIGDGKDDLLCIESKTDDIPITSLLRKLNYQINYLHGAFKQINSLQATEESEGTCCMPEDISKDYYKNNCAEHHNSAEETEYLRKQIVHLQQALLTKQRENAHLKLMMRNNKMVSHVSLSELKRNYEQEKAEVQEAMKSLRGELQGLKEDANQFSDLRNRFAERCDEYVAQLDEQQRQLKTAESEKETLSSMLRMAIGDKLVFRERLEMLENEKHRNTRSKLTKSKK